MTKPTPHELQLMGYTEQEWLKKKERLLKRRILVIKRVVIAMSAMIILGLFLSS